MKNWFINRWTSLKRAFAYGIGVFSWKLTFLYAVLSAFCWYVDISPIHFIGVLAIVTLIDAVSYSRGIRIEREIQNRIR